MVTQTNVAEAPLFSHPEYDFHSETLAIPAKNNGTPLTLHYVDEGSRDAPILLMVHGNPSWSFYYRNVVAAMRDSFRCIVPDHIGMGLSSCPSDEDYDYTLASRIDNLRALVDHISAGSQRDVHLVVHDWGGAIGLGWAMENAQTQARIRSLSVFNTAAFVNPRGKRLPKELWLTRTKLGERLVLKYNAFARGAARYGVTRTRLSENVRAGYLAPYTEHRRLATLRFVQDIPLSPKDPAYPLIVSTEARLVEWSNQKTPTFIGWGLSDFVFDEPFLRRWQAICPHAETKSFDDAGHYVLEDAWSDLQKPLREFLLRAR